MGFRKVPLTRQIFIERDDFMVDPPRKFFRLAPGREVRLRYACYITAKDYKVDRNGKVVEILAEFDPASRGGSTSDRRRVKGTIHFVSATENVSFQVRLYQSLFNREDPDGNGDFIDNLNPDSLKVVNAFGEPPTGRGQGRGCIPVRAQGILLCRSRHHRIQTGLQPNRRIARLLEEKRRQGKTIRK